MDRLKAKKTIAGGLNMLVGEYGLAVSPRVGLL